MLCKNCHYPLKQLSDPRCPECGCEFDPNDPSTYFVEPEQVPQRLLKLCIFGSGGYLIIFTCVFVASLRAPFGQGTSSRLIQALAQALLLWLASFGVLLLVVIVAWSSRRVAARREAASNRPKD